jgi:hypothetical protein
MRSVAATLASYLGAPFTTGDLPALNIAESAGSSPKRNQ